MIPDSVQRQIHQMLDQSIQSSQSVSGGSINRAAKVTLSDGTSCFLKWNSSADPQMFAVEEKGLALLRSADTALRIPNVLITGKTKSGTGFLLQEFINEGRSQPSSAQDFGKALAALHQHHQEHNIYPNRKLWRTAVPFWTFFGILLSRLLILGHGQVISFSYTAAKYTINITAVPNQPSV